MSVYRYTGKERTPQSLVHSYVPGVRLIDDGPDDAQNLATGTSIKNNVSVSDPLLTGTIARYDHRFLISSNPVI